VPALITEPRAGVDATLDAVAAYGLAGSRRALPTAPLSRALWPTFLGEVARERLAGLLGAAIIDGAFPVSAEQFEAAATLQTQVAATALLVERLLLVVAERLGQSGVDFRVLKGPAVAHLDYADPALRCFGDLDVLVRTVDFAPAVALLESDGGHRESPELRRGFDERFGKGAMIAMPGDLEVDLHRTFVAGPLGMTIDLEGLFLTATPFRVGNRQLAGLGTEERFLHACIHAGVGRPARLCSLRDIAQMLLRGDLDTDRVHALAHSWRATAVVARAVHLAWRTLDIADSMPLTAWAARYRFDASDNRLLDAYLGGDQSYTRQAIATLRVIPRHRDKVAYARSLLFPGRRYLDVRNDGRIRHVVRGAGHLRSGLPR
jgi:hypothetical protein